MKYMGSKRAMLQNGLGELLRRESKRHARIVDLFCGSASVSWFAAQQLEKPVLAIDLQKYAAVLASAIVTRTRPLDAKALQKDWIDHAKRRKRGFSAWAKASKLDREAPATGQWSKRARALCSESETSGGPIWRAYGGHYFSPSQSLAFDAMLATLPTGPAKRAVCLATTIIAASKCAAAPGHTAQPFAASRTAGPFLREAWERDPLQYAAQALEELCSKHAVHKGVARVADANDAVEGLYPDDLVFVDPPYSGVHYSRFYHVLETLARGECSKVEGVGRYPPPEERPVSFYSQKSESLDAMDALLENLAEAGCTVVLTFPAGDCSNGLSGEAVEHLANEYFDVYKDVVKTRFSTMGGDNDHREARQMSDEMILLLRPC